MALIKFFKTGSTWTVGNYENFPPGFCAKFVDFGGVINVCVIGNAIWGGVNGVIARGAPSSFCDASGNAYANLSAFEVATNEFFSVQATDGSGRPISNSSSRKDISTDPIFYFGWKQANGQYLVKKMDTTNPADIITTWGYGAWTNHLTLTYTE